MLGELSTLSLHGAEADEEDARPVKAGRRKSEDRARVSTPYPPFYAAKEDDEKQAGAAYSQQDPFVFDPSKLLFVPGTKTKATEKKERHHHRNRLFINKADTDSQLAAPVVEASAEQRDAQDSLLKLI